MASSRRSFTLLSRSIASFLTSLRIAAFRLVVNGFRSFIVLIYRHIDLKSIIIIDNN